MTEELKVLIADDDRILTSFLASRLKARGWSVDVALDAMQALMFAIRSVPSVILLDINMPGGSGFEVLRKLQLSVKTRQIPVVVMSSSHSAEDGRRATELGVTAFLDKPVDVEVLNETLVRVLSR
jgi:CheY-like chemotaxis protein